VSRLRILHCIYDDPSNPWLGGGGAHRVFELYRRLTDEVEAVVAAGAYPGAADGEREGVEYRFLGADRPYAISRLTYGMRATQLLREGDYDAAVFDFSVYTPIRVPSHRPIGHVVHMPIGPTAPGRWGRAVGRLVSAREARMLGRARRVQTTSHWMEAQLRPVVAPGARIDVVRSGVDDVFYDVRRAESDYVLAYGRLDYYQKGLDLLLDAYGRIRDRLPSAPGLVIAGRGDRSRVETAIRESGLAGVSLEAPVERDRVLELMAGARALLMPSRFEGLPVVPIEAMAAGVPVVAADVGGVAEIVDSGEDGVLVPPERADILADAALELLDDDIRRRRLSKAARLSAARFRWQTVADEHLEWLDHLTG
jgi:glycosyltransferase involved in cell wall biosynthesis